MTVYTSKRILPIRTENIPEELKARPQWVPWKAVGDKPDKVPYSATTGCKASSLNYSRRWLKRGSLLLYTV